MAWYKFVTTLQHFEEFRRYYVPNLSALLKPNEIFNLYQRTHQSKIVHLFLETNNSHLADLVKKKIPINVDLPEMPDLDQTAVVEIGK